MVPRKRASGDRTDQLPDTRRLYRNSVVGSTGRRIPTHSRMPIAFHQYLPAHGAPSSCISMTAGDSRRKHNWCGSHKQLERERKLRESHSFVIPDHLSKKHMIRLKEMARPARLELAPPCLEAVTCGSPKGP
jgi:hypothetical protein